MKKFKSTSMADFAPKLPQDLINEVLLRLPARSIGRFRCVSKLWRSFLSSPKFAKSHLNIHLHRDVPNVVLAADIDEVAFRRNGQLLHLFTFPVDGGDGGSRVVSCPFFGRWGYMAVLAACHGFVLIMLGKVGKFVLNPVTLESFELPDFELDLEFADGMYGMGYDSCSDDYKIVKLSYYEADWAGDDDDDDDDDSDSSEKCDGTFVDVYSLKMKCWRRVAKSPYGHDLPDSEHAGEYPGLFMNGFLHWVALDSAGDNYVISAFSLAREEFEEVLLPKDFDGDCEILQVAVLRGCFAIVCCSSDECFDVWLMKEYGVRESWEKLVINTRGSLRISAVLFLTRDDEFVLVQLLDTFLMKLIAYSLITGAWRDIVVHDIPDEFDQRVMTFTDCLLSPNHMSD